jgi:YVTN family beta-propeller protein
LVAFLLAFVLGSLGVAWATGSFRNRFSEGAAALAGEEAPSKAGESNDGSGAPASATPAKPVFHQLKVTTHPDGARVRITGPGGFQRSATTPFVEKLPEGLLTITLTAPGHNRLTERVDLTSRRTLDLYLDPSGLLLHELARFKVGPAPKQVEFTPDGKQLWVTDLGGDGVEVYDVATQEQLDDVRLGNKESVEVIFNGDGSKAYVTQMTTASVFEVDTATHKVLRNMPTKGVWSKGMVLSPDESTLFVSNWVSDDVSEIDLATGEVRRILKTVDTPRGLYVSPDGARLFVAGFGTGDLERFDLATGESKILLHTGGALRHFAGDAPHGLLYVDDMATDEVFVVDMQTERVRKLADTDNTPNTISLSPDGKVLYVSNRGRNNPVSYYLPGPEWGSVLAFDAATGKELDAIVGGNQTTGLDISPDGTLLAYSDFLDNAVSIFQIPSYQVLAAGDGGRSVAHLADLEK